MFTGLSSSAIALSFKREGKSRRRYISRLSLTVRSIVLLIPMERLSATLGLVPSGVIHVGAHAAEEMEAYMRHGWGPRVWVEALPDLAADLQERLASSEVDVVVSGAAWSVAGQTLPLNRASNGQSSSLLEPAGHLEAHPEVRFDSTLEVATITLDQALNVWKSRFAGRPNLLNLDIQGAELEALRGLSDWRDIQWVYTEISTRELYAGQPLLGDLDAFLGVKGFRRVGTVLLPQFGWGDALYAERGAWKATPPRRRIMFRISVLGLTIRIRAGNAMRAAVQVLRRRD